MPNAPWVICRWHITEDEIKAAFVTAFNKLVTERAGANVASRSCVSTRATPRWGDCPCASEEIAANARLVRQTLCDTTELEQEKVSLGQELAVLVEMTQNCIAENARIAQDQGEYQKRYNGLVERYEKAKARFDEVTEAIAERSAKGERLAGFIRTLEAQEGPVAEFDERLWGAKYATGIFRVDYVKVGVDGGMTVVFRDGTDILV